MAKRSSPKKVLGYSEYQMLKAIFALAVLIYILGIVPFYRESVADLFKEPAVKLAFLVLILGVGYLDPTMGILLAVAFLVSIFVSPGKLSVGKVVTSVEKSGRDIVQLPADVVKSVTNEMMTNDYQTPTAQQAFEASERAGNEMMTGSDCSVVPTPMGGCDPIVGYNAPYDCVCNEDCADTCDKENRGCLCKGVATWEDEQNAQGLNYPMGYAGQQEGATYN